MDKNTATETTEVQYPDGRESLVACAQCNGATCHTVLSVVETTTDHPHADATEWVEYLTIQCAGCKTVSFCREYKCSEDHFYNPVTDQEELSVTQTMYPGRIAGRPLLENLYYLPKEVRRVYGETHDALCNDLAILAGVGIRAIVEAVCTEKTAAGSNLKKRINALVPMGLITSGEATILHSLRFMGNKAAHRVKAHTQEELSAAFDVVEHVLTGVYILPKTSAKLPKGAIFN